MSFDTKKMIIATIIVGILFVLFLGYAFNNIQKVELEIKLLNDEAIDIKLQNTANEIIDIYSTKFVDDISLSDIDMDILLVDHESESSCIIKEQTVYAVDYKKLDKSLVYCNNYIVLVDDKKTAIINCDEILGNPVARAISNVYHYEYVTTSNLSPESVECFQTVDQDETISFYKYAMIESAKGVYFNDAKLDTFYYFYDQWAYFLGTNKYQEVINYDYYDGFKAFVYAKALDNIDDSYSMMEYLNSYKNQQGIYSKDIESTIMGMMWCLLMEKQGKNIIIEEDEIADMYMMLLEGVPQGQVEEYDLQNEYHKKFAKYIGHIDEIIKEHEEDIIAFAPVLPIITTEAYEGTIKVEDNHYIYIDYKAKDNDNILLEQDYVSVKMSPYTMKFFFSD